MNDLELFNSQMEICELHKNRIELAIKHIKPLLPIDINQLENLSEEDLGFLELMTSRFTKLQDAIGKKIFPLMLKLLQEYDSSQTFLDQLNKLEKLKIIDSTDLWNDFRRVRNAISHDYPDHPEIIAASLNECYEMCGMLIRFWEHLKEYSQNHIFNYYKK